MKFRTLMMTAALAASAAPALAADAPPLLVRGTIASIDAKSVTITRADGTTVTGAILPTTFFAAVEPRRFDQIKSTDFVGITSVPGPNDTLKAEEIHILPIHVGEGSYPWDHHPDGTKTAGSMTNGTVAVVRSAPTVAGSMTNGTVSASDGWSLKVTYHGSQVVNGKCVGRAPLPGGAAPCTGVAAVVVTPSTPIVAIVPAKNTDAKAGLAVFAVVATGPGGKPVVGSMTMEKNGIKPQM
ncbi:MAG: hypothetical protein WDN08_21475 [Rhizomicrobium sp.]